MGREGMRGGREAVCESQRPLQSSRVARSGTVSRTQGHALWQTNCRRQECEDEGRRMKAGGEGKEKGKNSPLTDSSSVVITSTA